MSGAFDGNAYRKEVLAALRDRPAGEVEDLFWLLGLPRAVDDPAVVASRAREVRAFLQKERNRARYAPVAESVLKVLPRAERTLGDAALRRALRERLAAGAGTAAGGAPRPPAPAAGGAAAPAASPEARRRRRLRRALAELGRLREDPELGADLFAFLGLPTTAPPPLVADRLEQVAQVNRQRRPDRERALVDDLLHHAREELLERPPGAYLAELRGAAAEDAAAAVLGAASPLAAAEAVGAARAAGASDDDLRGALTAAAAASPLPPPASALGLGVACAVCDRIEPRPDLVACARCAAGLRVACDRCGSHEAVDRVACGTCGGDLARERAAHLAARTAHRERERLARTPPAPPGPVHAEDTGDGIDLAWTPSPDPGVEGYLVARRDAGGERVLGRTEGTRWADAAPQDPAGTAWLVRALRGPGASDPAEARLAGAGPGVGAGPRPGPAGPQAGRTDAPGPPPEPEGPVVSRLVVWPAPGGVRLRWTWPPGVTEALVVWAVDGPPAGPEAPAAGRRKVTNTRYDLDDGVVLPGLGPGTHVAVFAGVRSADGLRWSPAAPPSARATIGA